MKSKFSVLFLFMALLTFLSAITGLTSKVFAEEIKIEIPIESDSAYLIHPESGRVLFSKNEEKRLPIASMCKIMTLLLTFEEIDNENLSLEDNIPISQNAMNMGGSQVFLESGASYKAKDLIKSIIVASANDSCVAIAEKIAGSEDLFVNLMNKKAQDLDMINTNFVNCTGLPKNGQFSCAKAVATMFFNLLKHKDFITFSSIWMDQIKHPGNRVTEISNTNKLIKFYNGCDSGKTGYTSEAEHCLCASAIRNGLRLISVIIKAPNSKTRFKEASDLFNYGFANYVLKKIIDKKDYLDCNPTIKLSKIDNIKTIASEDYVILLKKNEKRLFNVEYEINENLKAPIDKNSVIGNLTIYENGIEVKRIDILRLKRKLI